MDSENNLEAQTSYSKKAVGFSFNPSGDERVTKIKTLLAEAIDIVVGEGNSVTAMEGMLNDLAVDQLILAQMAAVKSVTFGK